MIVYCCPKCKIVDIGNENEEKQCLMCSGPMLSLGISSSDWNNYDNNQMKAAISECIKSQQKPDTLKQPVWDEDFDSQDQDDLVDPYDKTVSKIASYEEENADYNRHTVNNPTAPVRKATSQRTANASKKKVVSSNTSQT